MFNLITPTLEARKEDLWTSNKFRSLSLMVQKILSWNTNANQTKTPPQEAIKSKGMEFIKGFHLKQNILTV